MHQHALSERPRAVHLMDWSQKEEKNRHIIWCVAYRILSKGETKRASMLAVSESLSVPLKLVLNCCQRSIRITYHDQETEDHE